MESHSRTVFQLDAHHTHSRGDVEIRCYHERSQLRNYMMANKQKLFLILLVDGDSWRAHPEDAHRKREFNTWADELTRLNPCGLTLEEAQGLKLDEILPVLPADVLGFPDVVAFRMPSQSCISMYQLSFDLTQKKGKPTCKGACCACTLSVCCILGLNFTGTMLFFVDRKTQLKDCWLAIDIRYCI